MAEAMQPTYEISGGSFLANVLVLVSVGVGLFFAFAQANAIRSIKIQAMKGRIDSQDGGHESMGLVDESGSSSRGGDERANRLEEATANLIEIYNAITEGARGFLYAEYKICVLFICLFGAVVWVLVGSAGNCNAERSAFFPNPNMADEAASCWHEGTFTAVSFVVGGVTSIISGYLGMMIAVYTNARCTTMAQIGWTEAFNTAFRGGAVMGFSLCALGLGTLYVWMIVMSWFFVDSAGETGETASVYQYKVLMEVVSGFGLGGSCIALFGRVGGGIYTKAADVGADLVGKVEEDIPEDDPRNPATIADNVGDNVGDVAGMGADLFGSFAESTCAALVLSSISPQLQANWGSMLYPLLISSAGLLVCFGTTFVATDFRPVVQGKDVEHVLKMQLILSTVLLTPAIFMLSMMFLPSVFCVAMPGQDCTVQATWFSAFLCVASGLWSGLGIGLVTEYYTSHSYTPVREVAASCQTGAATNVIYGLALGYKSVIVPVLMLGMTILVSLKLCNMYGVALAALGMLSSLAIGLTIDAYGPICDNAGGIAEMAELGAGVRHITDTLDAAGNTTAAIGKGFAIGSAALVSLALYGAYISRIGESSVDLLEPIIFVFVLYGAMLPYYFTAMTMKSVGIAAMEMVYEVRAQFRRIDGLREGRKGVKPDYAKCVEISTNASLREMIAPGALVILTPIITGYLFGVHALSGLLVGSLVSSVQMAISQSNTGGAWDNAKKYIESGMHGGKGSDPHKAAVVGDTVGDPLKDTSGPALNIVMKLMAIISLVFAEFFSQNSLAKGNPVFGYK